MQINIGLLGYLVASSENSGNLSDVLVGCKVLHDSFGLGTIRAIDAATNRCRIQLDNQDAQIDCSISVLCGKDRHSTIYIKPASLAK